MNFGMRFKLPHALAIAVLVGVNIGGAFALDSDKQQSAVLEADDFELDLETGVRTYRGNVVFLQGSMRLDCDELTTYYNDDDKLDKGVCTGNPGRFKQRPEGRDSDILGRARSITLDRVKGLVTLKERADIRQEGKQIQGRVITYDLTTKKAKVTGEAASETEAGETASSAARPRLIIQPQKNQPD